MNEIKDILSELGYNLRDYGQEYRARPLYRDSDNDTVLRIRKDSGRWVDFKENISGTLEDLIKITLKLKDRSEAKEYLENKNFFSEVKIESKPQLKTTRTFDKAILERIIPDHRYWFDRNIDDDTITLFGGGLISEGRMKDRYVFPIFDSKGSFVGLSGRDTLPRQEGSKRPKWKHLGDKSEWKYPLQVNLDIIQKNKEVILVESIGDMLSLWQAGVGNTLVIFGLDVSIPLLNFLLRLDPNKIYISLNNDSNKNDAGNVAAKKLKNKFLKYFDSHQIALALPDKNDFGEMSSEEIWHWKEKAQHA